MLACSRVGLPPNTSSSKLATEYVVVCSNIIEQAYRRIGHRFFKVVKCLFCLLNSLPLLYLHFIEQAYHGIGHHFFKVVKYV